MYPKLRVQYKKQDVLTTDKDMYVQVYSYKNIGICHLKVDSYS